MMRKPSDYQTFGLNGKTTAKNTKKSGKIMKIQYATYYNNIRVRLH